MSQRIQPPLIDSRLSPSRIERTALERAGIDPDDRQAVDEFKRTIGEVALLLAKGEASPVEAARAAIKMGSVVHRAAQHKIDEDGVRGTWKEYFYEPPFARLASKANTLTSSVKIT